MTDDHDLEVMLVRSPAFTKVLRAFASISKINGREPDNEKDGDQVAKLLKKTLTDEKINNSVVEGCRETLSKAAVYLGYLRWISQRDGLNLRFKELDSKLKKILKNSSFKVNKEKLIEIVINHSNKQNLERALLFQSIQALESESLDIWHVCCGHDLTIMLGIALQTFWGSRKAQEVSQEILERELRLAYEQRFFQATEMCKSIEDWEAQNPSYRVLVKQDSHPSARTAET